MNSHPDLQTTQASSAAAPLSAGHLSAEHLSADQIDDQLIGDLAAAAAAHLAACSLCASRIAAAADPLASFQGVTTAWSERRSATLPIPIPAPRQPLWQRHMAWATACLTLAVGIALVNASHQFTLQTAVPQPVQSTPAQQTSAQQLAPQTAQQTTAPQTAQMQPAPKAPALTETASIASSPRVTQTAAQIAADNHMLRAIDAAFNPAADSPAALGLLPAGSPSASSPTSLLQD